MDKIKMLCGEELLDLGITKQEASLPILGLKDVTPNGSWLEQKQIQSALEARKHLIEAQRIDKRGVLSHAVWHEDLRLAEVTQQTTSHYRYLGHHKDRKLYLLPEEALYLMETNCLLLTYDEIVVSLQQAYSLLLRDEISISKYKVYAHLSRLGYKVFRHNRKNSKETSIDNKNLEENKETIVDTIVCNKQNETDSLVNENESLQKERNAISIDISQDTTSKNDEIQVTADNEMQETVISTNEVIQQVGDMNSESSEPVNNSRNDTNSVLENDFPVKNKIGDTAMNVDEDVPVGNSDPITQKRTKKCKDVVSKLDECNFDSNIRNDKDPLTKFIEWKLEKLKERHSMTRSSTDVHNNFRNLPDLSENRVVTVNVPSEELLPKNIFLNNLTYVLNVDNMTNKNAISPSVESRTYSVSDEVNGDHVRRVTNSTQNRPQNVVIPPFYQHYRQTSGYRPFQFWRPRPNLNYFQFNLFFQRPFMTNFNMPRFHFYPRTHIPMFPRYFTSPTNFNVNSTCSSQNREQDSTRKRTRNNARKHHLESIKDLAQRLRDLVASGNIQTENLEALQRLIQTYNIRYRTKVRITDQYEIINDETIIETIELDDDDQSKNKRRRIDDDCGLRDLHLNKIRQIALKLKQLDIEKKASARHRRALSALIKTYNKSYDADIYISDNNEILDRRSITLDSDSEPEFVVEPPPKMKPGKKLRNPFNILKRLSEKLSVTSPTTSKQDCTIEDVNESNTVEMSKNVLSSIFGKDWLPSENDFGRPEVLSRDNMNLRIIESKKEEYLYEFLKDKNAKFNNWVETKIAFLESIEESKAIFQTEAIKVDSVDIKSIIKSEDCTDMPSVLRKLSIIKKNNTTNDDCVLAVDFDVYNKEVQNFRKASRPTPHFRIVCVNDSSPCPSGIEVASLHSQYKDGVMIVFAIVGSASISFIQMNPTDSPVCNPRNN